jgi:hypothetical protein
MVPSAGGASRQTRIDRVSRRAALAATLALTLLAAACGSGSTRPPYQPPSGWHDITAPPSQPFAAYAISPDVPGLIVACIGAQEANTSTGAFGSANLWRTRDGGAHWLELTYGAFDAGCQLTLPPGGKGTIFGDSLFGSTFYTPLTPQSIAASLDAGDSWEEVATTQSAVQNGQQLPGNGYRPEAIQLLFEVLTRSVYRDGRLYTIGPVAITNTGTLPTELFSASTNYDLTTTAVESAPDPLLQQGFVAQDIAADYRAPNAWFRLLGRSDTWFNQQGQGAGHAVNATTPSAMLEHSADGGRTWQVVGPVGPRGALAYPGLGRATLATTPSQPARICAAFSAWVMQGQAAPSGGTPPTLTALVGSDDGGHSWSGGTVVQHGPNGGEAATPGVAVDARGDCYVGDNADQAPATPTAQSTTVPSPTTGTGQAIATFWRLAPGPGGAPQDIAQLAGQQLLTFGVTTGGGDSTPRLVALVNTPPPPATCRGSTCPPSRTQPPHLLWMAAP